VEYSSKSRPTQRGEKKQQARPNFSKSFELNESLDELRKARESGGNLAELKTKLQSAESNFRKSSKKSTRSFSSWQKSGYRRRR